MADIYAARAANAKRIGEKLKTLLDEGYMVFDDSGSRIMPGEIALFGFDGASPGLRVGSVVYFDSDRELDNGMQTTIAEFNAWFSGWSVVHPRDFRPFSP